MIVQEQEWVEARLTATRDLTPTIREFVMTFNQASSCPPGSHIRVRVQAAGRDDHRSYSVVSCSSGELRIAVKRQPESRGGSAHMWSLEPGAQLEIMPPRCDFPLSAGSPHYLLLAGGVGITPLIAMAERLSRLGAPMRMIYAARSESEFAYRAELEAMLGEHLSLVASDAGAMLDISSEIDRLPPDGELYMCGPLGLMEVVRQAWQNAGRPLSNLRFETFGSSGKFAVQAFTVKVPRLGKEVLVRENETMLDALEAAGIEIVSECRRGECGLCAIEIVEAKGDIDHRDVFFSAHQHHENRRMCACVSRVANGSVTVEPAWRGDAAFFTA